MRHMSFFLVKIKKRLLIFIEIVIVFVFASCVSTKLKVSEFDFIYNNTRFLIRSAYCPGNPESCNQIIGNNLIAVDLNQDRIIDKVTMGNYKLSEAQEIYDYCLGILERQNKLSKVKNTEKSFSLSEMDFDYEIKTLYPKFESPFNEFTIIDKKSENRYYMKSVIVDKQANGILDEILKGKMPLDEAQTHYNRVILKGLSRGELKKKDNSVIVK